ncbi:HAD-like domain-containing protein [Phlebopus sp. FC_14]|nr:HAD-like domain-containing protein [Phlebopus sp. FC_14]
MTTSPMPKELPSPSRSARPRIRALLIDISGTLLLNTTNTSTSGSSTPNPTPTPTPRAAQALHRLRTAHIPLRCCSNTSKASTDEIWRTLRDAGLDVARDEVCTSVGAVGGVLRGLGVKRPYMLLSKSAMEECVCVRDVGASVSSVSMSTTTAMDHPSDTRTNADQNSPSRSTAVLPDPNPSASPGADTTQNACPGATDPNPNPNPDTDTDTDTDDDYDAVVVGLAPDRLTYDHLNTAFRILVGEHRSLSQPPRQQPTHAHEPAGHHAPPRKPLIALHKAHYLQSSDARLSLGPGPFVLALEAAARVRACVVGKPSRVFFEMAVRGFEGARAGESAHVGEGEGDGEEEGVIAVIGDDVDADLGEGAIESGFWRVLVKTGKYRPGDETRALPPPDEVCASFADFVDRLLASSVMS